MIINLHTQPIDNELVNIINNHSLDSKIRSTFVHNWALYKQTYTPQTPIPYPFMNTGNCLYNSMSRALIFFVFLIACLGSTSLFGQQPIQQNPLAPLYKAKKVKSITAWTVGATASEKTKAYYKEFNESGNLTFELVYNENGVITQKYQSFYATNNKLTKEVWTQEQTDSVVYKYKGDKLFEESWYWGADKSRTRVVHFFDSLGKKVCTVSKNNWGVYVDSFFYVNGLVTLIKNYNENGQLTSLSEKIYDTKGRLTQELLKDEDGKIMRTNKNIFSSLGLVSSETILYATPTANGEPVVTASMAESFKYDSQKQLKEITNNSYTNNELLINNKMIFVYNDTGLPASQTIQNLANNTKQLLRFDYTFF